MSELSVMDLTGDTKLIWDSRNQVEVDAAKELFDKLKKKSYYAYKAIGTDGGKGEILYNFDPKAERIIMAPPMIGG